jgi:hypothetical protein
MAQANPLAETYAIIDDRRAPEASSVRSGARRSQAGGTTAPRTVALACGLILEFPLGTARQSAAQQPLAFPITDRAKCLATGRATVACRVAEGLDGRFVAAGPSAEGKGKKALLRDHAPA